MLRTSIINLVSKVGLVVPLLYTAVISLFYSDRVISMWPNFVSHHVNEDALSLITFIVALALAVCLFVPRLKFIASISTVACTGLVMLSNLDNAKFVFNTFPILILALGLAVRYYPRIRIVAETKVTLPDDHHNHDQHTSVPGNK